MACVITPGHAQIWNTNANGNWGAAGNWNPSSVPNAVGANVTLGPVITANRTITNNGTFTLGTLTINSGNNYTITNGTLVLGVASGNAIINILSSGSPAIHSALSLSNNTILNHSGTGTLTLGGAISGAGSFTMTGTGVAVMSGSSGNTYSGVTVVNGGELRLNKGSGNAIAGNLTIGDGSGTDIVRIMANNQIADSSTVTVSSSGQLFVNGTASDAIGSLNLTGGLVNTGTGTLTLTASPAIVANAHSNSSTVAGNIFLQGAKTIQVADGAAAIDLDITGSVLDMWYTSITKTGDGTLRLSGNNNFQGPLVISNGVVIAASSTALGASTWNNVIANGAALHLAGGIALNQGSFDLAGTGPDGLGAIRSLSGSNTYNGTLNLTGATTFGIASGADLTIGGSTAWVNINHQLTIENSGTFQVTSGNSLSVAANLVFNGNGNTTLSANSIAGSGTITKNGTGTMLINGTGTFSPFAMDVREGRVDLDRFFNPGNKSGLTIGTTSGPAAEVRLLANNRLRNDLIVGIRESGLLNLNGWNEELAALTLYGGTVDTGGGTLTLANAGGDVIRAEVSSQVATINGAVRFAQDNLQQVTINVADSALATELIINGPISQVNTNAQTLLVKAGAGNLELAGNTANTFRGITRVDGGTLTLNKAAGVAAIAGHTVQVNSGGRLTLANANQIADTANLILNGGTFRTGNTTGNSEKLGTLTLSAASTIDLGTGSHQLEFNNSSAISWEGTLVINHWTGVGGSSGTQGQLFFGVGGLTSAQLSQFHFTGYDPGAMMLSSGEVVPIGITPVPEMKVLGSAIALLLAVMYRERRRLLGMLSVLWRTRSGAM